jgi:hypothetical protein
MTRGLVLLLGLTLGFAFARPAAAQTTGDPFPFTATTNNTSVIVLGSCGPDGPGFNHIAYALGGASILASASPGGPLLASLPLPAGTLSAEQQAAYCPIAIIPGAPPGTYWVLLVYGLTNQTSAPASAWRQITIGGQACTSAPNVPVFISSAPVVGSTLTLGFTAAAQGCPIDRLDLEVGTTPGGTQIGVFPLPGLNTFFPNVPSGTYYTRARAVNAYGTSHPSTEIPLTIPGPCAANNLPPTPINPAVTVNGSQVSIAWTLSPATGATFHQLTLIDPAGFTVMDNLLLPAATSVSAPGVPPGNYRVRISAGNACGMKAMVPLSHIDFTVP